MGSFTGTLEAAGVITSTLGQIAGAREAARERTQALEQRIQQEQAASNQRSLQRTRQVNQILGQQAVDEAASGFTAASPSFGAISQDTFNQFAQDEAADNLNTLESQASDRINIRNAQNQVMLEESQSLFNVADIFRNARIPETDDGLQKTHARRQTFFDKLSDIF